MVAQDTKDKRSPCMMMQANVVEGGRSVTKVRIDTDLKIGLGPPCGELQRRKFQNVIPLSKGYEDEWTFLEAWPPGGGQRRCMVYAFMAEPQGAGQGA